MDLKIEKQAQNTFRVMMADGSPMPRQSPAAVRDIVLEIKAQFGVDALSTAFKNWPPDGGTGYVVAIVTPH